MNALRLLAAALAVAGIQSAAAQTPEWVWFNKSSAAETRCFRKSFTIEGKATKAELIATADDGLDVFVNGEQVLTARDWHNGHKTDVAARLKPGANVLAIRGLNGDGSPAGAIARLEITTEKGRQTIVTDASWKGAEKEAPGWNKADFADAAWPAVKSLGKLGIPPWGDVFAQVAPGAAAAPKNSPQAEVRRVATPAEALYTLPGFKTELLISGEPEEGSWVNLCKDNKGRLILSPQYRANNPDGGLLRVTLGKDGKVAKREFIAKPLYDAQGLTFANGALWVVVNKYSTTFASGLYRITDDGSDTWSKIELIKALPGGGEHGPHAVELGPDGNLYVMAGNHTKPPADLAPTSPHKNWAEDHVLPRQPDGNGHATGIMAPGGYVCRVSPDGKKWEFFCGGFRNQFDFAFNPDGELFVWDADMEWDWGMPWYRATRVNHATSGAEFGWRYGTGKWPDYHADSLGSVVDIGIGCPTGVGNGKGAKFPAKYQRAIYIMDWTYGRLMAVHLKPEGASYTATWENFVAPAGLVDKAKGKSPLNVTDLIIGDDGAMYFTIGGRGTASGLYRVTYTGKESTEPAWMPNTEGAEARALRRKLETYHGKADPKALDFIWPHLNSPDRAIRFAARIALEAQPVTSWQTRALAEKAPDAGLASLLALARLGGKSAQDECLRALGKWPLASLPERQQLDKLRVIQVSIARNGLPSADVVKLATEKLSASYPNKSNLVNRELSQVLVALGAPGTIDKTLTLMAAAPTQEDMIHHLFHLRTAKNWTADQRREYFGYWAQDRSPAAHQGDTLKWFEEAGRPYGHGSSYNNFYKNFAKEAGANLTDAEKAEFGPLVASLTSGPPSRRGGVSDFPKPQTRSFVKAWTMADFADLDAAGKGRNFEKGRQAFVDAQCLACHRFGLEGGGVGADLTAVASRFSRRDILESILDPSKVVSEQFQNTTVVLKNGDDHTGRLVDETKDTLVLVPNQLQPETRITVKKADVAKRSFSKISPMPQGLADALSKDDLLNLLAFIESAGRKNSAAFAK
ncbi:MAG: c-type cytochrome [Verrucomicrobia bacterium]|nr:c-type cytochrome [Verrucomicrobiota bacterium]